jgi:hypothetical protein
MALPPPVCCCSGCARKLLAAVTGLKLGIPRLPVGHPAAEAGRRALAMIAASGVPPQFKAPGALGPALALHEPDFGASNLALTALLSN